MKNAFIAILVALLVVVGYYAATTNLRLKLEGMAGKTDHVTRGDLTLPINATGKVQPRLRVEIKAEASGEVLEISKQPGDRLQRGNMLIRLQPDEEQRSVNRATQDLAIAKARLETAKLRLELARGSDLKSAEAAVAQLVPQLEYAIYRKKKIESLTPDQTNEEEVLQRTTEVQRQSAQLDQAKAALEKAKIAVPLAENAVAEAEASYEAAKANLADAEKRLRETDVVSPIDGILADMRTQVGAVIQGGKTTLMGGTVLAVVLDTDRMIVQAEVDESDVGRVLQIAPPWAKPGREASVEMPDDLDQAAKLVEFPPTITVEAFREEEFTGVIYQIYPEPQSASGVVTYLVDVVVSSPNRDRLLPGMRADVRFTSEHVSDVLLCPNEAIKKGPMDKFGVYVPDPDSPSGEYGTRFIACKFGLDNGAASEVREGLTEGMVVYTKLPSKPERERKR